jgi:hypothetical protein
MRTRLLAVFAGIAVLFGVAAMPAAAHAAAVSQVAVAAADIPGLEFGQIGYNAYGSDRPWNRNQEFIDIRATGNEPVDVKSLRVEDAWAHGRGDGAGKCNNFTINELPGVTTNGDQVLLQGGHTIRVYVGSGTPAVFNDTFHAVYMDHNVVCGYNGHFLNNAAQKDKGAPWDTVWMTRGSVSESKSYNFSRGYTAD